MGVAYKNNDGEWVVSEKIDISRYDLEGSIESIKAALDAVRDRAVAMGMANEGSVDISVQRGYYGDDYELVIEYLFSRYENDRERETRLANEAKLKAAAKAKRKAAAERKKLMADPEYAEFERLKAKFGA